MRELAHRRWVRRTRPFPHVVAQNVFVPQVYTELEAAFNRILREHPEAFRRDMAGYDAAGAALDRYRDGPLGLFASRPWHDVLAASAAVACTGDISASLHHHEAGSRSGWPHNDLNPGWFAGNPPGPDQVRLPGDGPVDYHHGPGSSGTSARQTVRAVSVLFFLANPSWQPGDGGQTGLFAGADEGWHGAGVLVPPVNNSLVLFECTPYSWHAFCRNTRGPRNAMVMWLHRPRQDAIERWGGTALSRGERPAGEPARRTCLLTGAGSRLGEAFCRRYAADYEIVAVYRNRVPDVPSQFESYIDPLDPDCEPAENAAKVYLVQADLEAPGQIERVVEIALARCGQIDLLVNNAAHTALHPHGVADSAEAARDADRSFRINVTVPLELSVRLARQSWRACREQNIAANRNVVNVSSMSGARVYPHRGQAVYAASKAALNHLTRHLGAEFAAFGVRVNALAPTSFPAIISTEEVVDAIKRLDDETVTGRILALDGPPPDDAAGSGNACT